MNSLVETLRGLLAYNVVYFTYRKVDGTIREAKGTRNLTLAGEYLNTDIPAPKTDKENPNAYYDLVKGAWRSFVPNNLISIDSIEVGGKITPINKVMNTMVKEVYCGGGKPETPKPEREIPIVNIPTMGGFGSGFPNHEEIRKAVAELDKDIDIPIMPMGGGFGGGFPIGGGKRGELPSRTPRTEKVGVPTFTDNGIELPIGSITIEDFAKLVAKYVVTELADRLTNLN